MMEPDAGNNDLLERLGLEVDVDIDIVFFYISLQCRSPVKK